MNIKITRSLPTGRKAPVQYIKTSYLFLQFSDFAKFVDMNAESFKGKEVLMYCTGVFLPVGRDLFTFFYSSYCFLMYENLIKKFASLS